MLYENKIFTSLTPEKKGKQFLKTSARGKFGYDVGTS
jgi:hypothetical protein